MLPGHIELGRVHNRFPILEALGVVDEQSKETIALETKLFVAPEDHAVSSRETDWGGCDCVCVRHLEPFLSFSMQ